MKSLQSGNLKNLPESNGKVREFWVSEWKIRKNYIKKIKNISYMTSLNIMVGSVHICLKNKLYIEIKHVSH